MFHFKKDLYTGMTPSEALPKLQEHVAKSFPNLVGKNRSDIINEFFSRRRLKQFLIAGYLAKLIKNAQILRYKNLAELSENDLFRDFCRSTTES
jgi:hypothetical protein